MTNDKGDALNPELEQAVRLLKEAPEVRPEWRDSVLREISASGMPSRQTQWSVRPLTAIAAGLGLLILGAGSALVTRASLDARASVAAARSADPGSERVRFALVAPEAATVFVVGDFNGWQAGALPMHRLADGRTWQIDVPLRPGRYGYAFLIDGNLQRDPRAAQSTDDDFGTPSSVIMVRDKTT